MTTPKRTCPPCANAGALARVPSRIALKAKAAFIRNIIASFDGMLARTLH
jgi:hypothetical protein